MKKVNLYLIQCALKHPLNPAACSCWFRSCEGAESDGEFVPGQGQEQESDNESSQRKGRARLPLSGGFDRMSSSENSRRESFAVLFNCDSRWTGLCHGWTTPVLLSTRHGLSTRRMPRCSVRTTWRSRPCVRSVVSLRGSQCCCAFF